MTLAISSSMRCTTLSSMRCTTLSSMHCTILSSRAFLSLLTSFKFLIRISWDLSTILRTLSSMVLTLPCQTLVSLLWFSSLGDKTYKYLPISSLELKFECCDRYDVYFILSISSSSRAASHASMNRARPIKSCSSSVLFTLSNVSLINAISMLNITMAWIERYETKNMIIKGERFPPS